jgi:hypothetical protein
MTNFKLPVFFISTLKESICLKLNSITFKRKEQQRISFYSDMILHHCIIHFQGFEGSTSHPNARN